MIGVADFAVASFIMKKSAISSDIFRVSEGFSECRCYFLNGLWLYILFRQQSRSVVAIPVYNYIDMHVYAHLLRFGLYKSAFLLHLYRISNSSYDPAGVSHSWGLAI